MVEGGREAAMLWWMGAENAPPENNRVPAGSCPRGAVGTPNQRLMVGTISKYVEVCAC